MKRFFFIFSLIGLCCCTVLIFASCQKNTQQRAEEFVKGELKKTLATQDYTPISFVDFDTLWIKVPTGERSPLGKKYQEIADSMNFVAKNGFAKEYKQWEAKTEKERNTDSFRKYVESRRDYYIGVYKEALQYAQKSALADLQYAMHGKFGGYRVTHKYKIKDRAGIIEEQEYTFYIDSTLHTILGKELGKRKSKLPVVLE